MTEVQPNIIYTGNSVLSVESLPEYAHPIVIKKLAKRHPSRRSLRALEKEYEMTSALDTVAGVRKLLGQQSIENLPALILEYIDGETLRKRIRQKTLNLREKLEIAIDLTRILGKIHQQDIIHLDLNSKNILIGDKDQTLHIIDLGSAARIAGNAHQKVRPDQMLGTLPYISPEQTGRINRALDERSDLYSLGVVLYELMTGQLPFDSKNALELIHHHIARVPVSPAEVSSEVPEVISSIVLKLLTKNAEERYQSAAGVQADLETCLKRLKPDNSVEEFPVGAADYTSRFKFSQKLYGRDSKLKELVRAFKSACRKISEIIFVSGYSGIGKTALVEEIQRTVSENRGYFIKGKFDQYHRTTPYTAITQAFAEFVSRILAEPEKNFEEWQEKIHSAVGDLGQVLTDVIPALEDLIGVQPEVPQLGGHEAENRFNYVFIKFLLTVATEKHPLVLFVDDLQWIDAASLRLLKLIRSDFKQPGLLVIGAYRDNEVDASHPLMGFMGDQEKEGQPLRKLKLENLQPQHLETFLSDTLRSQKGIQALGTIIYEKTRGNPFFTRRLLLSLYDEDRIRYDSDLNSWKWAMGDIIAAAIADNVADLLAKKIAQLPEETQNILKLAACIGTRFDIATLAMISGLAEKPVRDTLSASLGGQYVIGSDDTWEFVHDQVQQGGYALVAEEDRPRVHLEIGRLLLSNTASEKMAEEIFNIVSHFNAAIELLESESERIELAGLNLIAGQKARKAAAYADGLGYIEQGLALLGSDSWQDDYDLTLALHNEAAEMAYLTGHYEKLDDIEGRIHENAQSILDRSRIYYIRIHADTDQGNYLEAIEIGIGVLAELGIKIPREPTPEDYRRYQAEFTESLAGRSIEELVHLPAMTDGTTLAAMEILVPNLLNAFIAAPQLLLPLAYQGATLSLQNGNGPWSPFFFCVIGIVLCGATDMAPSNESAAAVKMASQLQDATLKLLENPKYARSKSKILEVIAAHILPWNEPLKESLDMSLRSYEAGLETGDLVFAALGIYQYAIFGLAMGMNLEDFQLKVSVCNQGVKGIGQELMYRRITIGLQTAHNFMTTGSAPHVLKGQHFDEDQWLPDAVATQDFSNLNFLFLEKLWLSFHFDCDDRLMDYAGEAGKYLASVTGMINTALFRFYDSLSRLRLYDRFSEHERQETITRVASNQLRMRLWSENAPMNFKHKYDLVAAETARVTGNIGPAMDNYEHSIKGARDNGFIHEEALANELYARFWQQRGNDRIAEMYMREARVLYHQWGAGAKVSHLENRYPQWFKAKTIPRVQSDSPRRPGTGHTTITQPITSIQVDLDSIINASQTLSAETDLEQLLNRMMNLVMANSGAGKAVLLLRQENGWFVQARSDVTTAEHAILLNRSYDPADSDNEGLMVPERVFHYCRRSKDVLVVGEAHLDQRFAEDRMIQKYGIKSIACIPSLNRGELKAMLYLENRQMPGVFDLERLEILQHLASQFGVSVENALLYDRLSRKVRELQESEERYEMAVTGSAAGIWDWELDSDKIYYSDRLKELLGYAPDELPDTLDEFWNRLHPDDYEAARRAVVKHLEERVLYNIDCRLQTKSGEYRWFHARGQALWDNRGKAIRMSGSITDITARKHAEEGLRQSKEFNQSVLMSLPDHIAVLDREGHILTVNDAWIQFARENDANYPDRVGPGVNYLRICEEASDNGDETVTEALDGIRSVLDGSSEYFEMEYPCDSPTVKRWFLMTVSPFKGLKGGVIAAHIDITSRKMAEIELRGAYTEIEQLKNQLEAESAYLQDELKLEHNFENIIGQSESLKYVLSRVEQVAPLDLPVLVMGETGTGKELVVRALHKLSSKGKRALVKVNCAALPAELIESELFGREKGAFTGATTSQLGRFELAKGSTLFLDEIGEMPVGLQAKLLRVLESGEFERLGSSRTLRSDARIIAATNRVLEKEMRKGRFREDLWYRLNVYPITVPPLRERLEDIPLLVNWFVDQFARKIGKRPPEITKHNMQILQRYPWPGNVRELKHTVEGAVVAAKGRKLHFELPKISDPVVSGFQSLEEMERDYILQVLEAKNWKIGGEDSAAANLGMPSSTLRSRMKKLGLKKPSSKKFRKPQS